MFDQLPALIHRYKADSESVYNTWFINNEERLKAFRSIRRGVQQVVKDIQAGSFGNDFKEWFLSKSGAPGQRSFSMSKWKGLQGSASEVA